VPVKERSFELFGDEKRLDALKPSQLFAPGRLTLDILRCRNVPATLSCVPISRKASRPWLIVENEATFHSFCRLNGQISLHAGIILGSGNAVLRATEFLASLLAPTGGKEFLYFGDLDREGIDIASRLHARLSASSSICVSPAEDYYAWMLQNQGVTNDQTTVQFHALNWFPPTLRTQVAAALARVPRLAQEMIGWELLCQKFHVCPDHPF